jgi:hypothetical protein
LFLEKFDDPVIRILLIAAASKPTFFSMFWYER